MNLALDDFDVQDVSKNVEPSYHWNSTVGALKFDEKWPQPTIDLHFTNLFFANGSF